ncbi:TPA: hypothetical protein N0F65_001451 [Lagenidium giganteum]|uniref:Uncharacterized protein n=1 Tax=Lagenidium giganteum TaxID=4803 RepID=A0AAV2Z2K2_9STRA|nr:TPA: hypothetical protein N0F65_001451 [Lagenidium giganteum]
MFRLPEFSRHREAHWPFHIANGLHHDLIIGRDLLCHLGLTLAFARRVIGWDGLEIPMAPARSNSERAAVIAALSDERESIAVCDTEERLLKILDAKYAATDLGTCIPDHLNQSEQVLLRQTLERQARLFAGGIGTMRLNPYVVPLKEHTKPYYSRSFPDLQTQVELVKKVIDRILELGVIRAEKESP